MLILHTIPGDVPDGIPARIANGIPGFYSEGVPTGDSEARSRSIIFEGTFERILEETAGGII